MNAVVSNKEKVVLVLDIGTSFVKIGLFDSEANPKEDYQIKFEHWMTINQTEHIFLMLMNLQN